MTTSILSSLGSGTGLAAIPTYLVDSKNETALATKFAKTDTTAKTNIAQLTAVAPSLTTADALLKSYKALDTVLTAFNLSDDITYTALLKKLMTQDPTSSTSLAKTSSNTDFAAFATAMDAYKTNPFADTTGLNAVISAYSLNAYETSQGNLVSGMQEALAFKRTASTITSVDALILNSNALKVAVGKTGLDYYTFAQLDYDQQVSLLKKDVKLSDFQDSSKVDKMAEQYLNNAGYSPDKWGAAPATTWDTTSLFTGVASGSTSSSVLSLFGVSSTDSTSYTSPVLQLFA